MQQKKWLFGTVFIVMHFLLYTSLPRTVGEVPVMLDVGRQNSTACIAIATGGICTAVCPVDYEERILNDGCYDPYVCCFPRKQPVSSVSKKIEDKYKVVIVEETEEESGASEILPTNQLCDTFCQYSLIAVISVSLGFIIFMSLALSGVCNNCCKQ